MRKRVELARAIAINPKLILLDEPMAGMNQEEKEDMARFIIDLNREWNITIMIEHDMGVVMDISKKIIVLDFGEKIAEGFQKKLLKTREYRRHIWENKNNVYDLLTIPHILDSKFSKLSF